jgi:iron complex outermembrane receptor protein
MRRARISFRSKLSAVLSLATLLFPFHPLLAAEMEDVKAINLTALSLEQLMEIEVPTVYGACKYDQKVTDAPASVTIITADEIKKYGYRTFAEILRSVRGFSVSNDRNYQYLGVRGFSRPGDYNSRVLLLIDGHRLNNNIYDQAPIGTDFPLDIDLIDRVEVIRGPGSSLYGTSAFFGVINVITRQGKDLKSSEVSGSAGNQETYSGRLSYGNKLPGGLEMLVSASRYDSEGEDRLYFKEFDALGENNGIADHADGDSYYSLFSKFTLRDLTLTGAIASREKVIPTGAYQTVFNDPRNRTTDAYGYLDLKYSHKLKAQGEVTARAYYENFRYRGDYIYEDPLQVNKDFADGEWVGFELMASRRFLGKHQLTAGFEDRYNLRLDQRNYWVDSVDGGLDDQRSSNIYALYMQDEYQILSNLSLIGGVRYDHYNSFGGTTSPRLALIYKPYEKSILKFLYGKAFRAPNVYEMFYEDDELYRANPDLRPERITTTEVVYDQYLGEHFRSTLSAYYYRIKGLISQQSEPDEFLIYENTETIRARGIEAEVEVRWADGLQGRASYVLQQAEDQEAGLTLTNSPRHQAKVNLNIPLVKQKLFAGAEVQYTSTRKTLLRKDTGGFTVTNLTLFSQNLVSGLDLSASVYNLFDKSYGDPVAGELQIDPEQPELGLDTVAQDGRTFRVKLTYRF